ncbi:MAG: CHC2 zinc finger domain-containing protein [Candidatus Krumholzibacteriia bacterium]
MDFQMLKRRVSIEQVLADKALLSQLRRRNGRLVGPCPVHQGDNPTAFVVSLRKNLWRCFTGCDAGGDVVELVRRLDGKTYRQTAEYLAEMAHAPPSASRELVATGSQSFRPFPFRLRLQADVDFFREKGIHPETARRFDAGLYRNQGFLDGCIGVRLHAPTGSPLGYAGRRLDPQLAARYGKWKFPPRLPRNQLLFNFHRIRSRLPAASLVLTECPWSVMRLHQIDVPAVALLGVHLSDRQRQLLRSASRLVLLLDGDPAGTKAAARIHERIAPAAEVVIASIPQRLDPDDLTDHELRRLLSTPATSTRS